MSKYTAAIAMLKASMDDIVRRQAVKVGRACPQCFAYYRHTHEGVWWPPEGATWPPQTGTHHRY